MISGVTLSVISFILCSNIIMSGNEFTRLLEIQENGSYQVRFFDVSKEQAEQIKEQEKVLNCIWVQEGEVSYADVELKEVDKGLIEAAKSFGASDFQIIFKVMIKEAMPSIISGITLSIISIIGYSAMAGAVGAGGVGAVALTYGYQRFDNAVMIYTVITLIIIVQLLQGAGNLAYKKLK